MLVTKALAEKVEACIKQSHIAYSAVSLQKMGVGDIFELKGGVACFAGHDSFLSQVVGWGFKSLPRDYDNEIDQLEQFYRQRSHPRCDIELSPLVGFGIAQRLSERNYKVTEFNQVSILSLENYKAQTLNITDSVSIEQVKAQDFRAWARIVARGFNLEEAVTEFEYYAEAKGIYPFLVRVEGEMAAGGAIAIHDGMCDLGVTSTLPAFRGQGLQKILLQARLSFALEQRATLAIVTTEPGSISDLNIQKMGFHCAYTRIKFSKLGVSK